MDIILLVITIVSLVIAVVVSVAAWRVTRDEKQRAAARVAALSLAASDDDGPSDWTPRESFEDFAPEVRPAAKAPWSSPKSVPSPIKAAVVAAELPLNQPVEPVRFAAASQLRESHGGQAVSHASGFLGAAEIERDNGSRQKTLALAAVILFAVLSGGLAWMMSGPEGTSAAAIGPNSPLELVSLNHQRQDDKLAISGLVRNPASGQPIQKLSAVVFLFDRMGTFVTSSKANVDFLKLGAGDESPFVVSINAPATVSRYRVSFRTDDGVVPHVDRRGETVGGQESTVKRQVVSQQ